MFLAVSLVSRQYLCQAVNVVLLISCRHCVTLVFRRPLHTKDLHHDFIVENIIGDQKVSDNRADEY